VDREVAAVSPRTDHSLRLSVLALEAREYAAASHVGVDLTPLIDSLALLAHSGDDVVDTEAEDLQGAAEVVTDSFGLVTERLFSGAQA
jgi:hypothetical protein